MATRAAVVTSAAITVAATFGAAPAITLGWVRSTCRVWSRCVACSTVSNLGDFLSPFLEIGPSVVCVAQSSFGVCCCSFPSRFQLRLGTHSPPKSGSQMNQNSYSPHRIDPLILRTLTWIIG
jgi:hypothetical protein